MLYLGDWSKFKQTLRQFGVQADMNLVAQHAAWVRGTGMRSAVAGACQDLPLFPPAPYHSITLPPLPTCSPITLSPFSPHLQPYHRAVAVVQGLLGNLNHLVHLGGRHQL